MHLKVLSSGTGRSSTAISDPQRGLGFGGQLAYLLRASYITRTTQPGDLLRTIVAQTPSAGVDPSNS